MRRKNFVYEAKSWHIKTREHRIWDPYPILALLNLPVGRFQGPKHGLGGMLRSTWAMTRTPCRI